MTTETEIKCPRCGSKRVDSDDNEHCVSMICKDCNQWWYRDEHCPTCGQQSLVWDLSKNGIHLVECWNCGFQLRESINGPPFIHEVKAGVWPKS
jgi:transcription elongation factor Elf1